MREARIAGKIAEGSETGGKSAGISDCQWSVAGTESGADFGAQTQEPQEADLCATTGQQQDAGCATQQAWLCAGDATHCGAAQAGASPFVQSSANQTSAIANFFVRLFCIASLYRVFRFSDRTGEWLDGRAQSAEKYFVLSGRVSKLSKRRAVTGAGDSVMAPENRAEGEFPFRPISGFVVCVPFCSRLLFADAGLPGRRPVDEL